MQLPVLETNLANIATDARAKAEENIAFVAYLKELNTAEIDETVFILEQQITPKIDCTQCGNCCKTLMIGLNEKEANHAADYLSISRIAFDEKYVEKSLSGKMLMSNIPCHFMADNKCSIYENRFASCREFPALHLPEVQKRLFTIFMHYDRCPIIFNVMESLKIAVRFR